jgi:hypothetical protein
MAYPFIFTKCIVTIIRFFFSSLIMSNAVLLFSTLCSLANWSHWMIKLVCLIYVFITLWTRISVLVYLIPTLLAKWDWLSLWLFWRRFYRWLNYSLRGGRLIIIKSWITYWLVNLFHQWLKLCRTIRCRDWWHDRGLLSYRNNLSRNLLNLLRCNHYWYSVLIHYNEALVRVNILVNISSF